MARSAEARRIRRELDKELESAGRNAGQKLEWSAAERAILDLISAGYDRISDLNAAYEAAGEAGEVKLQVKLSTEMRLLEQAAARLLRLVKTDLPAMPSSTSRRASAAANTRWDRVRASG